MTTGIPKQLLYGQLAQGKRLRGRPKLRYKDTCKTNLSKCGMDVKNWEEIAVDKTIWRAAVKKRTAAFESSLRQAGREASAKKGKQVLFGSSSHLLSL